MSPSPAPVQRATRALLAAAAVALAPAARADPPDAPDVAVAPRPGAALCAGAPRDAERPTLWEIYAGEVRGALRAAAERRLAALDGAEATAPRELGRALWLALPGGDAGALRTALAPLAATADPALEDALLDHWIRRTPASLEALRALLRARVAVAAPPPPLDAAAAAWAAAISEGLAGAELDRFVRGDLAGAAAEAHPAEALARRVDAELAVVRQRAAALAPGGDSVGRPLSRFLWERYGETLERAGDAVAAWRALRGGRGRVPPVEELPALASARGLGTGAAPVRLPPAFEAAADRLARAAPLTEVVFADDVAAERRAIDARFDALRADAVAIVEAARRAAIADVAVRRSLALLDELVRSRPFVERLAGRYARRATERSWNAALARVKEAAGDVPRRLDALVPWRLSAQTRTERLAAVRLAPEPGALDGFVPAGVPGLERCAPAAGATCDAVLRALVGGFGSEAPPRPARGMTVAVSGGTWLLPDPVLVLGGADAAGERAGAATAIVAHEWAHALWNVYLLSPEARAAARARALESLATAARKLAPGAWPGAVAEETLAELFADGVAALALARVAASRPQPEREPVLRDALPAWCALDGGDAAARLDVLAQSAALAPLAGVPVGDLLEAAVQPPPAPKAPAPKRKPAVSGAPRAAPARARAAP